MITSRRSKIDIIAEILRLGETSKTRVMYQANMSHTQLQGYLGFMLERGLLDRRQISEKRALYAPTPSGLALLDGIEKVQALVGATDELDYLR